MLSTKMIKMVAAATAMAFAAGNTCYEQAPFDCPEGTYCTSWSDGCNTCGCGEADGTPFCSMMYCPCLDDNSCVPSCNDNDQCVPKTGNSTTVEEEEAVAATLEEEAVAATVQEELDEDTEAPLPTHPFTCPDGQTCTEWTDGCNNCRASGGNVAAAACTEKYCACYDDDSCVPECFDNAQCVPAAPIMELESGAASFMASWLPVLLLPAAALGL